MTVGVGERRHARRFEHFEEHRIVATRVRPGHRAQLVDISAGGALIETQYRLLPGTSVELHMETDTQHIRVRGEVLRCAVVRVRPTGVCYCGAIRFDRYLPWFVAESGAPLNSPDSRPLNPLRASATPKAI
jgi:hypothetical protein